MDRGRYRAFLSVSFAVAFTGWAAPVASAEPPPSVQATPAPSVAEPVVVHVYPDGKVGVGREPGALSLDEMAARLQTIQRQQGVEPQVILRSNENVPYSNVVQALDKLRSIGITHTAFAGGRPVGDQKPLSPPPAAASPGSPVTHSPAPPEELKGRGARIRAAMMEARQREEASAGGTGARLARMTPEEREAFDRNLRVWRDLPPDERQDLRKQANERNREEVMDALRDSGLHLTPDQKEVFALRYLQERRKLERDIQEQASAERARRLPQLLQGLKREFAAEKAADALPAPTPSVSVPPVPKAATNP